MRLGIVGPKVVVKRAHAIIKEQHPNVRISDLIYEIYTQAPILVEQEQPCQDALLFMGKTPFKLAEVQVRPKIPWEYMPREGSILLRALLEAAQVKQFDIRRISFDTFTEEMLHQAYQEIGIPNQELHVFTAEQRLTDEAYSEYLVAFHKHNYRVNRVTCCISGITEIYEALNNQGIPCIRTTATATAILSTYRKLELRHLIRMSQDWQIVVIVVRVNLPNAYSMEHGDEYLFALKRNDALARIYLFASRIKAAVVENSDGAFLLFTTKKILESETSNLEDIYLFDLLRETDVRNVVIGVGYGETVAMAKLNAYEGADVAEKHGGNAAYAVYGHELVRGPFRLKKKHTLDIDGDLLTIAKRAGISGNTISHIYRFVTKSRNKEFTSRELSRRCDMSTRNMNRILQRLEQSGYCEIVGERIMSNRGRPSRIFRFSKY